MMSHRDDEFNRKKKRRIVVYGLVARYGPRISCHTRREFFCPKIATFSQF